MCGGITFKIKGILQRQLEKYYTKDEVAKFNKTGLAQSFFWSKKPVLAVKKDGKIELVKWGNRDNKDLKLPQTGWAKSESIKAGKWNYLKPEKVKIPIVKGYEKGVWFSIKSEALQGLLVEKDDERRIYIITQPATPKYQSLTKHDRQPVTN